MSVSDPGRATALYVVIEADETAPQRAAAAAACPLVQSVMFRAAPGAKLDAATAGPLVQIVQAKGIAAILSQDARLARTLKADGVHIAWSQTVADDYAEAREILGARAIVGADGGRSRHDAMELAEAGADYVGFRALAGDGDGNTQLDFVAWWGEIFQVPCVAFDVTDAADAAAFTEAGADFVGLTLVRGETLAASCERLERCRLAVSAATLALANEHSGAP